MTIHLSEIIYNQQLQSCRVSAQVNIVGVYANGPSNNGIGATLTTSSSTLTVDSVVCNNGDSVLLSKQTLAFQNGIYVVSGVGNQVILTRRSDFQEPLQMLPGFYVPVSEGTVSAGTVFTVIAPSVQVVGVSDVNISAPNGAQNLSSVTLANDGLNVLNSAGTFAFTITPDALITADAYMNLNGGPNNSSLVWQEFPDLYFTAFGGGFVGTTNKFTAQALLGIKSGTSVPNAGASATVAFPAGGIVASDLVTVTQRSGTNPVSIETAVPSTDTITVTFSGAPGANTVISWIAIATV